MTCTEERDAQEVACACSKWAQRGVCRYGNLVAGVLFIAGGLIWYGVRTGWFSAAWLKSDAFWPVVLMVLGTLMVLSALLRK